MKFAQYIVAFLVMVSALSGAVSCERRPLYDPESGKPVRLVVDVDPSFRTKATDSDFSGDDESVIGSLQVFVFRGDVLDGYGRSDSGLAVVNCTTGERLVYAVANAGDLSGVSSPSGLLSSVSSLGGDVKAMQMIGSDTVTVTADESLHIEVSRIAARVVLKGIKFNYRLDGELVEGKSMTVKSVYLVNVAGDCDFGQNESYEVDTWYNKGGYDSENGLGAVIYDSVSEGTIANGESLIKEHRFYAYPNANALASGIPWSPRATELVICAEYEGATYYYPVKLPALVSNHSYVIELVNITRLGNVDDQESVIEGIVSQFNVSSKPWEESVVGSVDL